MFCFNGFVAIGQQNGNKNLHTFPKSTIQKSALQNFCKALFCLPLPSATASAFALAFATCADLTHWFRLVLGRKGRNFYFFFRYSEHIKRTKAARDIFFSLAAFFSSSYRASGSLMFKARSFNLFTS